MHNKVRIQLGLVMAGLIFVVIGVGVVLGAQDLITDAQSVSHSHEVIRQLDEGEAHLRTAEAALRGYLLTESSAYLSEYHSAIEALPPLQAGLARHVADNPEQAHRAAALGARFAKRREQMTRTLVRYRNGGLAEARSGMDEEFIAVSTAIRLQVSEMRDAEHKLLELRAASTAASATTLRVLALLGIPIGLATIVSVHLMLVREVRQRRQAERQVVEANRDLRLGVEQLERSSADLRALTRYGSMLQSCKEPDEAIDLARRILEALVPDAAGTIYRMRDSQDHAEALASWGEALAATPDVVMPDACWALRRAQPYFATHGRDPTCPHVGTPRQDGVVLACLPLSAQGVQLGLLHLTGADERVLASASILEAVAEQLSMALSNLYLQERLRLQSIREPLTGLFNRRYLEESATREFARCTRRNLPLTLMMLDVDHFKMFNDVHGHAVGDLVLSEFGRLLQAMSRTEDIACRYGGEEFTLILPEAPLEMALQRAELIRAAVEAMRVAYQGGILPQVTVSIGVAAFPSDGQTPETVLRAADEALYRAKKNGRNRVESAAVGLVAVGPPNPLGAAER